MDRGHRLSAERIAIDSTPVAGGMPCSACGRVKPLHQFRPAMVARGSGDCRQCHRIATQARRERPEVVETIRRYYRRPDVTAAYRARHEARDKRAMYAQQAEYLASERGRHVAARKCARYRLRRATTDHHRGLAQACIDRHTAALAALDAEDEWA